jgi:hypothetical protein
MLIEIIIDNKIYANGSNCLELFINGRNQYHVIAKEGEPLSIPISRDGLINLLTKAYQAGKDGEKLRIKTTEWTKQEWDTNVV